ncbi:hypothetical protein B0T11DRAFT_107733 [Plectosphaerella cucumerina]|uniref:VOC domain-containing protein n=1 Tax=Plectosphaerella cucumerina TaxID=40658 RepID=A0A8K0X1I8_9PEZI|nr:hypothetical protein B0T11DRAFT_107733 [Plectosphaerella cucumerina]
MSDWKPPKFGSPIWMAIPAEDVPRASKFYKDVFDFDFKPNTPQYPEATHKMFDLAPKGVSLSGGIEKVPNGSGILKTGGGGVCIHWFVEDVEKSGEVIEKAGGVMLSEAEKEGEHGLYRFFRDTEGNVGSVYQMV